MHSAVSEVFVLQRHINTAARFDPQGVIIKEPAKPTLHKTKLATSVRSRHDIKQIVKTQTVLP
jgi:hypothetical protein